MIRRAFTMRLKPGGLAQYKHWHDNIWPELVRELEASGIATVCLSMIPELTRATGAPRVAGIAYPLSRPMGRPGDADSAAK